MSQNQKILLKRPYDAIKRVFWAITQHHEVGFRGKLVVVLSTDLLHLPVTLRHLENSNVYLQKS